MSGSSSPPRLARWIAEVSTPREDHAQVLGDLHERFVRRVASRGRPAAARWYWLQACGLGVSLIPRRVLNSIPRLIAPGTLRAAFRALLRSPQESGLAVVTLGIGIAAPTGMFALADGTTTSLPGDPDDRVVSVHLVDRAGRTNTTIPWQLFRVWNANASTSNGAHSSFGAYRLSDRVAVGGGDSSASRYRGAYATAGVFDLLQVRPLVGRIYPDGQHHGGLPAVLIREDVWEERFDRDPAAIGTVLRVDGADHVVFGVLPLGFGFPSDERIWIEPVRAETESWRVVGRLEEGMGSAAARENLAALLERIAEDEQPVPQRVELEGYTEAYFGREDDTARRVGVVSLLLVLITAANVASIMLARGMARSRETSTRLAMGASRGQVVALVLTEVLLLAVAGTVLGLLAGRLALKGMVDYLTRQATVIPYWIEFGLGARSIGIAASLTLLALLVAGGVPAAHFSKVHAGDGLRPRGHLRRERGGRVMATVVGLEIALSCFLLSLSGFIVGESTTTLRRGASFATDGVLTGQFVLERADYPDPAARRVFFKRLSEKMRSDPDVREVSLASALPGKEGMVDRVRVANIDVESDRPPLAQVRMVDRAFFRTLGLTVAEGRSFSSEDRADAPPVSVVNRAFARERGIDGEALGREITVGPANNGEALEATIVGVVDDGGVTPYRRSGPSPGVYLSIAQVSPRAAYLMVKAEGGVPLLQLWRENAASIDPYLPLGPVMTLEESLRRGRGAATLYLAVFMGLGAASLLVALVGLYGSQSSMLARRVREIGVRRAVGAGTAQVVGQSMLIGLRPAWVGLAVGVPAGILAARGVITATPHPITYLLPPFLLVGASVVALWRPARRAAMTDPMEVLRNG